MSRKTENTGFQCKKCRMVIKPLTNGSYRNHCPYCLYSLHLDQQPGDRESSCRGLMAPVGLDYSNKKGYQIIHKCIKCGKVGKNKVAINTEQEDQLIHFLKAIQ
ncbi:MULTISPECIES: RNHCP domain-containing protein [Heyndrickxia]|uniref:RNHCP domain-containing protein n=1 Tax=Heyndrickxia oleronia TaxID=38875 RepID=A0A8E2I4V0_9BACI|nr:RNHCP domain-containing protein [Heyndrickxia oleronia]MCI1593379.1 RNHCP domain-containing protein [Heyndrickxia oleronia]MCI1613538.1 RNHCP domain-containing protein [Heyndrickxia oleronia]MCI1761464.1 RNHCP domain-containing protein [Heyndrickxia oleronia]MCM3457094.1 RNHCP domain-containing protein [Heyndrickxia oleronia]MEC1375786.1 RNHCP domain-containing protein [Heyndrickxia oleronia]